MYTVFANATKFEKYIIRLQMTGRDDSHPGTFQIVETTNGKETAFANLGSKTASEATREYNRRITDAAKYDGIFYIKDLKPILNGGVL